MAESDRAQKPRDSSKATKPAEKKPPEQAAPVAQRMPGWLGAPAAAPFPLGVQRKVAIGASNDTYERQADQVASRVVGGQNVPPGSISPIAPASLGAAQRESKPEEKKKEEKPAAPVQRAARPEDTKRDIKSAGDQLQRAEKPDDKKKDEKPAGPAPVQKQAKPDDKKKDDKAASPAPVQKQAKPEDKKKDEKPAGAAPVQKQAKPEEKKKDEKPAGPAPVQKQAKPEDKKKDEKPAGPAPVQKQAKPEEKKKDEKPAATVQRAVRPEDKKKEEVPGTLPVQREGADDAKKSEAEPVQASRAGSAPAASMESAASNAIATKGPGEPLAPVTRSTLESRMGTDLSDVRVHNDSHARDAATALNARAFTHGSDIWLGRGESQSDTRLMAHEATHVVQQTGSVHRMLVQRVPDKTPPAAAGGDSVYSGEEGEVKKATGSYSLTIPELQIPTFKLDKTPKSDLTLPKKTDEDRPDDQVDVWEKAAKAGKGIDDKLDAMFKKAPPIQLHGKSIIYTVTKGGNFYVMGPKPTIKQRSLRPSWDKSGNFELYQVDHIRELQLGGDHAIENMWLLEAEANQSSGRNIRAEKNRRIQKLLEAAKGKAWDKVPDLDFARRNYDITFKTVKGGLPVDGKPAKRWELSEIKDDARQLQELEVLDKTQIQQRHLQGSASTVVVFTNEAGGGKRVSEGWKDEKQKKIDWRYGKLFHANLLKYDKDSAAGSIHVDAFEGSKLIKKAQMEFDIQEMDAVEFGGYVSKASVKKGISDRLEALGLSAIQLPDGEFTETGLVARGKLKPSIRPFDKLEVDIVFDGNNIYLSKVFSAADFNFPGPIKVTSASLELYAGTQGIGAKGDVLFEIENVGQGKISAGASVGEGLTIAGEFEFDTKLFDPAKVHVEYQGGKFSGGGDIGIKEGKVKGIKSASIKASFMEDVIDAKGSIKPDIPAVEQADLSMHYDPKGGLTIAGDLTLKKDIPGIEGGSIHAEVTKKGDKYTVKASGDATPKIPGISSKLVVSYDDGLFDASVTAGYEKGMLSGSVTLGATNRPVDEDGKPAGEAPSGKAEKLTIYGGGSVTLKLAPWLQATAGIKFKPPNGEVEVTGKIGLPSALNLFEEKKVEKNIFHIGIPIPIFPGISLNIGGGLDVNAGIGPGQLQEMEVGVTYNPAHEEDTTVHGHAALHIPAHAGLRMNVHAALDVGIPLADIEGGIELGGALGIEGALHAAVDVDWSPKKGLVLDANAEIYGEPKLRFDITGYVKVEVGYGWLSKTLWDKRWELAAVEYGSGLRFGLKLPVHYEEGKPFNVSLSDVQFVVPDIDAKSVLKGLMDKII